MLCGPAGCGKSTFAARHFLPTQIVSSDDCRARLSDDPTDQRVSEHAFELMHFVIKKRLLIGRLTVADAMHLESEYRRRLIRIARWYGFNAALLVFDISLETCLARNAARSRVVPEEILLRQYAMFENARRSIDRDGFDYTFVLDEASQGSVKLEIRSVRDAF
ncbi:MAG: AAA family ATPase [Blastocatellia bacterium]|nr:AAA family ATPase [Blastocatellia bacterium]